MQKFINILLVIGLFTVGIVLVLSGACANPIIEYASFGIPLLDTWGIIWRIILGIVFIVGAVLLNNLDSGSGSNNPYL